MVYVAGTIGFLFGFILGQMLLSIWLKDRSRRELVTDKSLHYRYGLFNWMLAGLSCYLGVKFYQLVILGTP